MAWTAPRTWTTEEIVTAAVMNSAIRDNLNETGPAKATTKGDLLVASGVNAISRLAVGTDGHTLVADSAQPLGVKWGDVAGTHTHGMASNSDDVSETAAALSGGTISVESQGTFGGTETTLREYSPTFTGTPAGRVASGYIAVGRESSTAQNVTARLYINNVQVASSTKSYPGLGSATAGIHGHIIQAFQASPTSGHAIKVTAQSAGSTFHYFAAGISNRTVNVA